MSERLTAQEVEINGRIVGYQFSRTTMGKRTIKTGVEVESQDSDTGLVYWKGRTVKVERKFPDCEIQCLRRLWKTVECVG